MTDHTTAGHIGTIGVRLTVIGYASISVRCANFLYVFKAVPALAAGFRPNPGWPAESRQ
jgi:hypothetical protein